jgi:hypothetical protein
MFISKKTLENITKDLNNQRKELKELKEGLKEFKIILKSLNYIYKDNKLIIENIGSNQMEALLRSRLLKGDYTI